MDHHTGRKRPKHRKVPAWPGTPLLIDFSIVCKSHREQVRGNLSTPFSVKIVRGQKHPKEVDMYRNSAPHINHFILSNIRYRTTSVRKGQATLSHSFPHQHTPSFRHLNTNYIKLHSSYKYRTKLEVIGRKHIVQFTGFGAYSSTCYNGQTNVPAPWESISSHPPRSGQRH